LHKSLHGLRQTPHQWFAKISSKLLEYGFNKSNANYYLFTDRKGGKFITLLVYVDDIILIGNDLGVEVATNSQGLFLC